MYYLKTAVRKLHPCTKSGPLLTKQYWKRTSYSSLLTVCGCFCTSVRELSGTNGDHMAHKACHQALYRKSLRTPVLGYNSVGCTQAQKEKRKIRNGQIPRIKLPKFIKNYHKVKENPDRPIPSKEIA